MCLNPLLQKALTPKLTKYNFPLHGLTRKQIAFLLLSNLEVFYGGAAGGAKTAGLIQAALQYVDVPGYNALLIRDTYQNMIKPEGIQMQAHQFLSNTDAIWQADKKCWLFPSGATLGFGYMDGPLDHFNYQGPAYQFIGFDEVVGIRKYQYEYLFSRLRRLETNKNVPLRMRSTSNPPTREQLDKGGWVKERFIDDKTKESDVPYVRAKMDDNPYLDSVTYQNSLSKLDPVTRKQLQNGDWDVHAKGRYMDRADFIVVESIPSNVIRWVRFWDLAATEPVKPGSDPDYTCGLLMGKTSDSKFIIASVLRFRLNPTDIERTIINAIMADGRNVSQRMEQEGGASGKIVISHYKRLLLGRDFKGEAAKMNKFQRATPFMQAVGDKRVMILVGCCHEANGKEPYTVNKYLSNQELFPDGPHDDDTDGSSGAFTELTTGTVPRIREAG